MSSKTFTKQLRPRKGRDSKVIEVSEQIRRWRERLKKEGRQLGCHSKRENRYVEERRKKRQEEPLIEAGLKKWFK